MAEISAKDVAALRKMTGAGMMDCKKALLENDGDFERAKDWLREKGIAGAAKRSGRAADQGAIEVLVTDDVAAVVELNCETDFVAKGEEFRKLAKELALQVAGYQPRWVSREDVPDDVLVHERNLYEAEALQDGKPAQVVPRIVEGQVENFLKQNCLLEQPYFREPSHTVQQLIAENISKLQENIVVRRFARFNVRES